MTKLNDEAEMDRLLTMLGIFAQRLDPNDPVREVIAKSMIALIIVFGEGQRALLEKSYTDCGGTPQFNEKDLYFQLQDPEKWVTALDELSDADKKFLDTEYTDGTIGAFIKAALIEVQKRRAAPNIKLFKTKPEPDIT